MKAPSKKQPENEFSRREFSQLFLMLVTMIGIGQPLSAGAGIDQNISRPLNKRRQRSGMTAPGAAAGVELGIDFPTDDGWYVIHRLHYDEYRNIEIDPDDVSPKMHRQLAAAKAAPWKTPVVARVSGDPIAILSRARYFEPGEPDDRNREDNSSWRIEWFGDGISRIEPDNTSWWPARLACPPEFSNRERAFMEVWLKHNDEAKQYGINSGHGLAQDLMLSTERYEKPPRFEPWMTNRERKILSTFVQWLGTNCGQSFLSEVKNKGGIRI